MRNPFGFGSLPDFLREKEVHELLRDFPELLPLFDKMGIRGPERGTETVDFRLFTGEEDGDGILSRIRWRRQGEA